MARPTDGYPSWATTTGIGAIIEPDADVKATGWTAIKPPFQWMNWIHNSNYRWIQYLDESITSLGTITGTIASDLDAVEIRMGNAESDISAAEGNISSMQSEISDARGSYSDLDDRLDALDSRVMYSMSSFEASGITTSGFSSVTAPVIHGTIQNRGTGYLKIVTLCISDVSGTANGDGKGLLFVGATVKPTRPVVGLCHFGNLSGTCYVIITNPSGNNVNISYEKTDGTALPTSGSLVLNECVITYPVA